ncbi:MAG TPA: PadR family transcriptional regulator [Gemmatimonadales bacterium]|jgi:transcriptional regulator|nr:PadR family transcriptional regulator [Gemmatimonadales bacterium]
MTAARARPDLMPGTLDMLVLRTLSLGPQHGYAISQHLARISDDVLKVEQGSLYPALERLLGAGWVTAKWGHAPSGRRARYYTITASGRRQLGSEISAFDQMTLAIAKVLGRAEQG